MSCSELMFYVSVAVFVVFLMVWLSWLSSFFEYLRTLPSHQFFIISTRVSYAGGALVCVLLLLFVICLGLTFSVCCLLVVSRSFLVRYRHCLFFSISNSFFSFYRPLRSEDLPLSSGVALSAIRPLRKLPSCCFQ